MTLTDTFSVSAGANSFYHVADSPVGTGNAVYSSNLVVMYFPTPYGTVSKVPDANVDPGLASGD
jgi:hypothetical protein